MKKLFNQDNLLAGTVIGVIAPWICFGILYLLNMLFRDVILKMPVLITTSTLLLISIVVDVFIMRQYMVKYKYEKTGKGLLVITFVYVIAYFVYEYLVKGYLIA